MKIIVSFIFLVLVASALFAAPECNIDERSSISDGLLDVITGNVKGFQSGPVYVTVTNSGKKFTTMAEKGGLWGVVYTNTEPSTEVLCWQPWKGDELMSVPGK